jgi:hypothetical protein
MCSRAGPDRPVPSPDERPPAQLRPEGRRSQPRPGVLPPIALLPMAPLPMPLLPAVERKAECCLRSLGWDLVGPRSALPIRARMPRLVARGTYPAADPPGAERTRPAERPEVNERPSARLGADDRPNKGARPRNCEWPANAERPIDAGLVTEARPADARSADGDLLNTEPPNRERPIRVLPNRELFSRELFSRERARGEFRAMAPPSMLSPRREENLTLAAVPPSPVPLREPPVANAAPSAPVPSEPPWPSFSRGSRLASGRPDGTPLPWPRRLRPRACSPLLRSPRRSLGVAPGS